VLAVGSHMKNVISLAWNDRVVISPHIGEMDTARSLEVFENTIEDLQELYDIKAEQIICDAHPGYTTTRWAHKQGLPVHRVFHHHAHASAAYFETQIHGRKSGDPSVTAGQPVLVFTWDGVGYGEDGTLWGGETFLGKPGEWQRIASMRPFHLPGGDKAGRQPWRSAAAMCWELGQEYEHNPEKDPLAQSILRQAWQHKINTPQTSSVGRMFDAAAALAGVCEVASFEGQGPMLFEALAENKHNDAGLYIECTLDKSDKILIIEWKSLILSMIDSTLSVSERAWLLHNSLAYSILQQAKYVRAEHGVNTVSFSGGVFQNRVLCERAMSLLSENDFQVCLPELIPVNDAGISFGQVIEYGYSKGKD